MQALQLSIVLEFYLGLFCTCLASMHDTKRNSPRKGSSGDKSDLVVLVERRVSPNLVVLVTRLRRVADEPHLAFLGKRRPHTRGRNVQLTEAFLLGFGVRAVGLGDERSVTRQTG